MYPLTQDEKDWLQQLIDLLPNGNLKTQCQYFLDHAPENISDAQINAAINIFEDSAYYEQMQEWGEWVKGGSRPKQPH